MRHPHAVMSITGVFALEVVNGAKSSVTKQTFATTSLYKFIS